jgi:hypothetical protein
MIVVNLPRGCVQQVEESKLLWIRKTFDSG